MCFQDQKAILMKQEVLASAFGEGDEELNKPRMRHLRVRLRTNETGGDAADGPESFSKRVFSRLQRAQPLLQERLVYTHRHSQGDLSTVKQPN